MQTNSGPDHCLMYLSVQISLVSFLHLNIDFLCVGRTALYHSWHNPVEWIISVLNLGLECGAKMTDDFESEVSKCSNLTDLGEHLLDRKSELRESLSGVKATLHSIFPCLKLHNEAIQMYESAT